MPEPNTYTVADNSDANTDTYNTNTDANADCNSNSNGNDASGFADTIGDPAAADTKAKANAVPSAYAVSEWVKS